MNRPVANRNWRALWQVSRRGFTLVELLVVITIVTLLLSLVVPTVGAVSKANQLSMGIQTVVSEMSVARQSALTRNRVVEVRFYKFQSAERLADAPEVAALQAFIFDETNMVARPLAEVKYLPNGAVISDEASLSSIITDARLKNNWSTLDVKSPLPNGINLDYQVYRLRYLPDGSTDLGSGAWFLTLHGANEHGVPPPNHAAIQIDAFNGSLRLYRPG